MTILLMHYLTVMGFLMGTNFFTILIQDTQYYLISPEELGSVQGTFNTYISIITLPVMFVAGFVIDKCGRRATLSTCAFIAAAMLAILPFGHHLYPGLLVIKAVQFSALEVITISPLLTDYVEDKTKGMAGGYMQLTSALSSVLFSFGLLELSQSVDLAYVCWIAGAVAFLIAVYCFIFIFDKYARIGKQTTTASTINQEAANHSFWTRTLNSLSFACRLVRKRKFLVPVYITGIAQRCQDLAFSSILSVWVSKYIYEGNIAKISEHNKLTLGAANIALLPLGLLFGYLYDRIGQIFTLSLVFFLAGAPYVALYFLPDLDTNLGLVLQIIATIFSQMTNAMANIMLSRHAPQQGAGKVFAFRSFIAAVFLIGFIYLTGWMIDQSFNKLTFLLIGGIALSQVVMFLAIRVCCKQIAEIKSEEEQENVFLLSSEE